VGLIDYRTVALGAEAVTRRIDVLKQEGISIAIVDATSNAELMSVGPAWAALPLLTAASGLAIGLPANFNIQPDNRASLLPVATGLRAVVSGSCSVATNQQVADFIDAGGAAFPVDPMQIAAGHDVVSQALDWAEQRMRSGTVLIYATAQAEAVRAIQSQLGVAKAGEMVEQTLAAIARGLVERGVRQLVVAGGETSGACVQALGIERMRVGQQIAPGVPWCHVPSVFAPEQGLHITLKSGNFGARDFFTRAFDLLK